jgi:Site-specific recombinase XerD
VSSESPLLPLVAAGPSLVEAFLAGRGPQTLRAYRTDLEQFAAYLGAPTPEAAVARLLSGGPGTANALVLGYRNHLIALGRSAASVNRPLAALRSLVKLARTLGLVTWSLEVPGLRAEPYRDTRGPGADGVRKLLAAAEGDTRRDRRDRAILRLLYDLGLRRGEVAALDVDDVDLARGTVSVVGKGRTAKTLLTLAAPTRAALAAWLEVRGSAPGPLFVNFDHSGKGASRRLTPNGIYRLVKTRGESAGVKVAPHGLRHTAITEACKAAQAAGIGLEEVLDFSRHRDVKVLMIYRDRERNVQGTLAELVAEKA